MDETLALYKRFEAETGDPVAASNLTLAYVMLQRRGPESVLTAAEVADRLKVSVKKIYRLCQGGVIPHHRVGDSIRIKPEDLDQFTRQSSEAARPHRGAKWV